MSFDADDQPAAASCLAPQLVHATAVAIGGRGIMLRGRSGAGKSDLALRLIDEGAVLIADDQVRLERRAAQLFATAPETIAGMLEARGIGLMRLPHMEAPVHMLVDLRLDAEINRLPVAQTDCLMGVDIPVIKVDPRTASASAKIRLALAQYDAPPHR